MKVSRGFKYKLLLKDDQKALLRDTFFTSNQAWNIVKSLKDREYKENQEQNI